MSGPRPAPIDVERLSRHEARRLQIEDCTDDIGYLPHVADRVQGIELGMGLDWMHRGFDDARCNSIHTDAALRVLDRQRSGGRGETAFCQ